jgi:hypothetical protein
MEPVEGLRQLIHGLHPQTRAQGAPYVLAYYDCQQAQQPYDVVAFLLPYPDLVSPALLEATLALLRAKAQGPDALDEQWFSTYRAAYTAKPAFHSCWAVDAGGRPVGTRAAPAIFKQRAEHFAGRMESEQFAHINWLLVYEDGADEFGIHYSEGWPQPHYLIIELLAMLFACTNRAEPSVTMAYVQRRYEQDSGPASERVLNLLKQHFGASEVDPMAWLAPIADPAAAQTAEPMEIEKAIEEGNNDN